MLCKLAHDPIQSHPKMDWKKLICWELHISRLSFSHHNWRAFGYTPWLPQKPSFQWIYLIYRYIVAFVFVVHLIWFLSNLKGYFFIFLTNWGLTFLTMYLVWSAVSVTIRYMEQILPWCERLRAKQEMIDMNIELSNKPVGYCCPHNTLRWYEFIHWALFLVGSEIAVCITLLYWTLLFDKDDPEKRVHYSNFFVHLINSIVVIIELWITRLPIRVYHVIYIIFCSCVYLLFTGLYYAGGGGNPFNNGTYIYPVLDYGNDPGLAIGLGISSIFVLAPLVHLMFYGVYILREVLLMLVYSTIKKYRKSSEYEAISDKKDDEEEDANYYKNDVL